MSSPSVRHRLSPGPGAWMGLASSPSNPKTTIITLVVPSRPFFYPARRRRGGWVSPPTCFSSGFLTNAREEGGKGEEESSFLPCPAAPSLDAAISSLHQSVTFFFRPEPICPFASPLTVVSFLLIFFHRWQKILYFQY